MIKVLITNGENLRAVMFMKALAGTDVELHVAAERWFNASFFSRYCHHGLIVANPKKNPRLFLKQIKEYAEKNKIEVIIPLNAEELKLIISNRKMFKCIIPFVDYKLFNKVNDKWEFYKILRKLKIPTPKTIRNPGKITYPAILKIRRSAGSKGVVKVKNKEDMLKKLKKMENPIIQEFIGYDESFGAAALCRNGKVLSVMIYKNLRQYPVQHGTSTSRISIHDKYIEKNVRKILKSLKWHGIAQFDVLKKGKKYYFLEMNPRFYTSLNVTVKSGLNYPYYLCNPKAKIPKTYKDGVVCKVFTPDAFVFMKGRYPLKEFLNKGFKEVHYDDFELKDPLPSIPLLIKSFRGKIL